MSIASYVVLISLVVAAAVEAFAFLVLKDDRLDQGRRARPE